MLILSASAIGAPGDVAAWRVIKESQSLFTHSLFHVRGSKGDAALNKAASASSHLTMLKIIPDSPREFRRGSNPCNVEDHSSVLHILDKMMHWDTLRISQQRGGQTSST